MKQKITHIAFFILFLFSATTDYYSSTSCSLEPDQLPLTKELKTLIDKISPAAH